MSMSTFGSPNSYLNGSSYTPTRETATEPVHDALRGVDEPMERIRDLILGDLRRSWDARLQTLENRLHMLELKVEAARHEAHADRQDHLAALAEGIDELGQHVRRLTRA